MSVTYNGKKITPAPLIIIDKTYIRSDDSNKLGVRYGITIHGTLLPFKGSPNSAGEFATIAPLDDETYESDPEGLNHIIRKQEAIRQLFKVDGQSLEWQAGGQPVVKCNPRIIAINFDEGIWAQKCDYTITFETERIYINGSEDVEDTFAINNLISNNETWEFQPLEEWNQEAFNVTHTVNAQGIRGYTYTGALIDGKEAWQHAKAWCDSKAVGVIDSTIETVAINQTWGGKKYTKSTIIDECGGSCSISETWIVSQYTFLLEKTFTYNHNDRDDTYTAKYDGRITGLGMTKTESIAYAKNAVPNDTDARLATMTALSSFLGSLTLPVLPLNKSIGADEHNGIITFSFDWDFDEDSQSLNAKNTYTASMSYDENNDRWIVNLSQDIEGYGTSPASKVANAKAAILNDIAAKDKTLQILNADASLAVGSPKEKSQSINSRTGVIRASWSWTNASDIHDLEVSITTIDPSDVVAILPILGRITGPIIQDMNTTTPKRISITITGYNYNSDPGDLAENYKPIGNYFTVQNQRRYSQKTKQFNQTKEWVQGN